MSIFVTVKGGKIQLQPDPDWTWKGFDGDIEITGTQSLLSVDNKPVIIQTDFPQTHQLGKNYSTQNHSTPGTVQSVLLSVNQNTLSTQVFSEAACVTEDTGGSFQAVVTQPALTPNGVPDPLLLKSGKWRVVEPGQEIMVVEAPAPRTVFLDAESTSIADASENKPAITDKTATNENQPAVTDNNTVNNNSVEMVEVELFFCYQDGTPICQAPYRITDSQGQEFIGTFSDNGVACLTVRAGLIEIECGEDGREYQPNNKPQPNSKYAPNLTAQQILQQATIEEKGIWDFVWGVLQGDFNKDPTTDQIIISTIITMIPILDQIGDARDLTANIITLTDEKERNKPQNWLILLITLIGMFPTLGSILKGLFKYILKKGGNITKSELLAVSRRLGKGEPENFLMQLDWESYTKNSIDLFEKAIDKTQTVLKFLDDSAELLGEQYAKVSSKHLHNLLDSLESIKALSKTRLKEAIDWYRTLINKKLTGSSIKETVYSTALKTTVSNSGEKKLSLKTEEIEP